MAGKICMGSRDVPNDPVLSRAYCEGRQARKEGALSIANPHTADTPENLAWHRGWLTYDSTPAQTWTDCCAIPGQLATRSLAVTADTGDTTGATYDSDLTPNTPCAIDWGDGSVEESDTGDASHVYAASGEYTVKCRLGPVLLDDVTITVAIVAP